ncbi:MAG: phage major capsid protein [Burkholderiaceae bacterium]|nr:phage major capsid protein [Burkholderiaceae bacterium]
MRAIATKDEPELHRYRELSDAVEAITGPRMGAQTYLLPADLPGPQTRDMTVSGAVGGGPYLIGNETLGFADALSKRSILGRLPGVQLHQGLKADQTFLRGIGKPVSEWLAEDGATPSVPSDPTLGAVSLVPKTVVCTTTVTRQLLLQGGPLADAVIRGALAGSLAEAVDLALISGSGNSGQPLGVSLTPGINSRAGTSFALSDAAAMLTGTDGYSQADTLTWVVGATAAEILRKRPKVSGGEVMLLDDRDRMLAKPVLVSRAAPASTLLLAQWAALHFCQWGALEVAADPFTMFNQGLVVLRALWRVDFGIESPAQVAVATTVT